jgi:protein-tyrosine-phosphatase
MKKTAMNKTKVLFLDLENGSGSQMAEAYLRYLGGDLFEAFSAGIAPQELNPMAAIVMDEVEIDISRHYCKNVEEFLTFHFKFVITVSELDIDPRPSFHSADHLQNWPLPCKPAVQGSFQAELEAYRDLRNKIEHRVWDFISANLLTSSGDAIVKQ